MDEENLSVIEHKVEKVVDNGELSLYGEEVGTGKGITKFGFNGYGLKIVDDPVDIKVNNSKGKNGEVKVTRYETTLNWNLVSGV